MYFNCKIKYIKNRVMLITEEDLRKKTLIYGLIAQMVRAHA